MGAWSGGADRGRGPAYVGLRRGKPVESADWEDGIGVVEGDDEGFAAEAVPGDDEFPEAKAIELGMRAVEEVDEGAGGKNIFAGAISL